MPHQLLARVIGTNDLRGVGYRLGYWLPLSPWPVFLWIQSHDEYSWSTRHLAEPMYAMGNQARLAVILLTTIGAVNGLMCEEHGAAGLSFCLPGRPLLDHPRVDRNQCRRLCLSEGLNASGDR